VPPVLAVIGGSGAALAWAVSTLCSSRSSRLIEPTSVVAWVMVLGLLVTAPIAVATGIPQHVQASALVWLVISGAGNVLGLILSYRALRIGQVTLVTPLVSTEGAIAATIAVLAGETIEPGVAVTLAVIVLGISLAAVPPTTLADASRRSHPRAVALAIAAACSFGLGLYATARAGSALPSAWVVLSARVIGTVVLTVPLALSGKLQLTRRAFPLVVTSGICEVVGFFFYTAGSRHGIAVASVLASQFAAIAALAAYVFFNERLGRLQLLGVVIVLAGVAVLSALQA
jgi:drug/metabolite transporter (DMT)-like permease